MSYTTSAKPRFWTKIAIECYERNCICEDCYYSRLEEKCKLKNTVLALVRLYGVPKNALKRNGIREE